MLDHMILMQASTVTLNPPSSRIAKHSTPTRRRILRSGKWERDESLPYYFSAEVNLHPIFILGGVNLGRNILRLWWILNDLRCPSEWISVEAEKSGGWKWVECLGLPGPRPGARFRLYRQARQARRCQPSSYRFENVYMSHTCTYQLLRFWRNHYDFCWFRITNLPY